MSNTLKFGNGVWAVKKGSTLAYNDTNGNYKPLPFTFDRAGSATRVNKQGLIEVVSNNEPRIDFLNDSKGALLLEPSRSNRFSYSEDFSSWGTAGTVNLISGIVSPKGDNSAYTVSGGGDLTMSTSLASTGTHIFSIYAKGNIGDTFRVFKSNGFSFSQNTITIDSTDWKRYQFSRDFTSTSGIIFIDSFDEGTISLWGAQLEQGSYATSYIPTQGSIGTRVAESCSQTVPDGVIGQTEGTVFLDSKMALQNILNYQLFSINNGGNSDRIRILTATGNRLRFIYQLDGGTTFYSFYNPTDYGDLTNLKIAFTYKSGDIKVYINGVLADSSTNTFTIAEKLIDIDIASVAGGYNQMLFNDIKLYNTALTDQELINLTKI